MRSRRQLTGIAMAALASLSACAPVSRPGPLAGGQAVGAPSPAPRPNVVVILADDLGWNDVSRHGNRLIRTPNIDSIAADGAEFTNGYSPNAVCAPARAALLTGRSQQRFGFEFNPSSKAFHRALGTVRWGDLDALHFADREAAFPADDKIGLPAEEITLAEMLKTAGYRTAHVGKWHLGATPNFSPASQGFDRSFGFPSGATMYAPRDDASVVGAQSDEPIDQFLWKNMRYGLVRNGRPAPDRGYTTDLFADEAVKFIRESGRTPFFLYLAFNAPHTPLQAPKAVYDRLGHIRDHKARVYYASIVAMDDAIGRVMRELRAQGVEQNTIVVFSSDNGGASYIEVEGVNRPLRGFKATFLEGGIRVPYFLKWPAVVRAGQRIPQNASLIDITPTAAAAAGVALPRDRIIDGRDLRPVLAGSRETLHDMLVWRTGHYRAIRAGDFKLLLSERPKAVRLYDLRRDPSERRDLSATMPAKVAELWSALERREKEFVPPRFPSLMEVPTFYDRFRGRADAGDEYVYWPD